MKACLSLLLLGSAYLLTQCSAAKKVNTINNTAKTDTSKGLKDYYKDYFTMGVAVSPQSIKNEKEVQLILKQFSSITPENSMKMGPIHPHENEYNWKDADAIIDFAQLHHLKVRGHNLCWHEQTPDWFFKDSSGKLVTKEVLLNRLKEHISTVVKRYKGKIYAWDVVNEAIDDNPNNYLRNSLFYQICGEDFIAKAFEYAHAADPDALLFYNDYNTERKEKTDRIYTLLKTLQQKGVPIDAVGLQGHWSIYEPLQTELEYTIQKFTGLNLKIQITEMDVSVFKWEKDQRSKLSNEEVFSPEREQQQAEKYNMLFKVFRTYKQNITGITFWNISDKSTWLDNYPVRGRKNYPLLFDVQLQPKKAFWEVVNF
ncbi:MAG: endo-1,4-beta-xylanase [Ferruginibacter sp.]|nr:endo-1,4-beta-xylanase [Ferruginibacter sp.]